LVEPGQWALSIEAPENHAFSPSRIERHPKRGDPAILVSVGGGRGSTARVRVRIIVCFLPFSASNLIHCEFPVNVPFAVHLATFCRLP